MPKPDTAEKTTREVIFWKFPNAHDWRKTYVCFGYGAGAMPLSMPRNPKGRACGRENRHARQNRTIKMKERKSYATRKTAPGIRLHKKRCGECERKEHGHGVV